MQQTHFYKMRLRLFVSVKVSVKENELTTEENSSRASIFATKASCINIKLKLEDQITLKKILFHRFSKGA